MVAEYLEKKLSEFETRKSELQSEEKILNIRMKENIELIKILENANDDSFEAFTPRKINNFQKDKIEKLLKEQNKIKEDLNEICKRICNLDVEIDEIKSVIRQYKKEVQLNNQKCFELVDPNDRITILRTQESERQRIARDLHDTTVQCLTSIVHKTELCLKLMDIDPIRCRLELVSMTKILRDIIEDTRNMIYNLRPMSFDDIGFDVTVERFLDKLKNYSTVKYSFHVDGDSQKIDSVISITLLRVIQEACSNSIKHGNATEINVSLKFNEDNIELNISDNGSGFDDKEIPCKCRNNNTGFGLSMMKERIYLLSGKLSIKSNKNKGCLINVKVPINYGGENNGSKNNDN